MKLDAFPDVARKEAGAVGVRTRARARTAQEAGVSHQDAREAWDDLLNGLCSGDFCGTEVDRAAAATLLGLLERLGWKPSANALIEALPHHPERMTVEAIRDICARLGYGSEKLRLRPDEIDTLRLPALALGSRLFVLEQAPVGSFVQVDCVTGARFPPGRGRSDVVFFDRGNTGSGAETTRGGSWIRALIGRHAQQFRQLFGLTFLINGVIVATSLSVVAVFDLVVPPRALDTLLAIGAGALFVMALELALRRIRAETIAFVAARTEYSIGTALFSKLVGLSVERTSGASPGAQIARLNQFETVRDLFGGTATITILDLPFAAIFTAVLFLVAGPIGFVPLGLAVCAALAGILTLPAARRLAAAAQLARAAHHELYLDMIANMRTIRSLGCEDVWRARLDEAAIRAARAQRTSQSLRRRVAALSAVAPPLAGGATVLLGAFEVMAGNMSAGALVACMIVVWRIVTPVQEAMLLIGRATDYLQIFRQIDALLAMPSEEDERPRSAAAVAAMGRVTLANATYRYPGSPAPAVAGLTLDVRPGEMLAVTGPSGSGKTTLLKLAGGLIAPQAGVVALDGRSLRHLAPSDVCAVVGFVAQRPAFLHGTIAQNLRFGAPGAKEAALAAAADELGILEMVRDLPEGFDTRLTEARQARLPRGMRQALSIARALLCEPRVLLLDEPAQALDPLLESALLSVIQRRRRRTTIIMVSHRPSHLKLADRLVTMGRGRIAREEKPAVAAGTEG